MAEQKSQSVAVTKDMTVADILEKVPQAADIMQSYGLHCFGCHVNVYESLEMGALGHGMDEATVESIIRDINEAAGSGKGAETPRASLTSDAKADVPVGEAGKGAEEDEGVTLEITQAAAKKILEIRKQQGRDDCALRIGVVAGGCAGYTYNMDFEKTAKSDDYVVEISGVPVHMDKKSAQLLGGTSIDYVESLQGAGFKFNNPRAHASCGCGKSFT